MNEITMESIEELAKDYWLDTGKSPTHIFMTKDQHTTFSKTFYPKEMVRRPSTEDLVNKGLACIHLSHSIALDVIVTFPQLQSIHGPLELPFLKTFGEKE